MNKNFSIRKLSRRDFIKLGAQGALLGALANALPAVAGQLTQPRASRGAAAMSSVAKPVARPLAAPPVFMRFAATDNMTDIFLPARTDPLYIFGFVEVPVGAPIDDLDIYKGAVQMPSPILAIPQETDFYLTMTNLGFVGRPDLDDSHTIHWHGFRNPIALFDGVPEVSIAVPVARNFPYFYRPHDPGTYMYHCHFEDSEHVQMGMDGIVFVRPAQDGTALGGFTKFAYNDGDGSTGFDREWALLLNEIDERPHDGLLAVQEFVWSDYNPSYWIINGRAYPDTILPNNDPSLPKQPISSLIQINAGERGLLRFANLGYEQHAMQMPGITMKVVGEDATLLRGPAGADLSYMTTTLYIGPGEARDVLFTAPAYVGPGPYDTYLLKNRSYHKLVNGSDTGHPDYAPGGMMTEVRVYPAGTLPAQSVPNETF
jgi:FtsP/CotA-like multicopper oxidase with cupredoxin domain